MEERIDFKDQEGFYNKRWEGKKFANRLKLLRCAAILDAIASTKIHEPRIIDLGCGTGWLTNILGSFGEAVGVDLSSAAIEQASIRYPRLKFIKSDFLKWDNPKNEFDIVVSQEVFEHLRITDRQSYVDLVFELLRKDGYFIITTPNIRTFAAMPEEQRIAWSSQPVENLVNLNTLSQILSTRFRVIKTTSVILGYGNRGMHRIVNSKKLGAIINFIGMRDVFTQLALKANYGLHYLVVSQKE